MFSTKSALTSYKPNYMKSARIVHEMLEQRDRRLEEQLILGWYLDKHPTSKMPLFKEMQRFSLTVAIAQELNHAHS